MIINVTSPHFLQHLAGGKLPQFAYNAIFDYYEENGGPTKEDELGNWAIFPDMDSVMEYYENFNTDVGVCFEYMDNIILLEN